MLTFLYSWLGATMLLVFSVSALFTFLMTQFYREPSKKTASRFRGILEHFGMDLESAGGYSHWRLAIISMFGLFLEMLLIRWVSSEIRIFAYFKNLVLIACFLGFGLGCYFSRRRVNVLALVGPLAFIVALVKLPIERVERMWALLPTQLGASSEVNIWGVPSIPLSPDSLVSVCLALAVMMPLFALTATVFMPVGQMVGWYLEKAPKGIYAYSVNVLASIAGIGAYTLLCFLNQPPWVWFVGAGILTIAFFWRTPLFVVTAIAGFALCVLFARLVPPAPATDYWSPYQKLTVTPYFSHESNKRPFVYMMSTNDVNYQQILDLSPEFIASHPRLFPKGNADWNSYNVPYRFQPHPDSVLVLGAGTGNDVAAALRNDSRDVVAVEIDPLILKIGRQIHFEHPYDSPRVRTVVDDARSYIQNGTEQFDLIVYSLLDSHTTSSYYSNIRIDNYVYTLEAMQAAKRLLKPDGLLIVKFQVDTPWIAGRLDNLLEQTFGHAPLQLQSDSSRSPMGPTTWGRFFITGSQEKLASVLADPEIRDYVATHQSKFVSPARATTDDWPYFYQHEPGLPLNIILITVLVPIVWWGLQTSTIGTATRPDAHFFFLGAGFMLLESQIVSKMALLFGTTWVVNSIVIAGLLLLVVAANILVDKCPRVPVWAAYAGIFGSIVVAYAVPLNRLFFRSVALRATVATLLLCMPVFFAGIVFIRSFAQVRFSGRALGSNLLGALAGGILESLSFWTGLRALLIIAALFYLGSAVALWISMNRKEEVPGEEAGTLETVSVD